MSRIVVSCLLAVLIAPFASAQAHLLVVDGHVASNGDGSVEHPFKTIAAASHASGEGDVIYVTPSADAYAEAVTLKRGQALVGLASDEAIRSFDVDLPGSASAATIHGEVSVTADNLIAGLTIVADRASGITGRGTTDKITVRGVHFRTSNGMFGLLLADHRGDVAVEGGELTANDGGGGVSITGGRGNVFFDNFPMSGRFSTAVLVSAHNSGFILFREASAIRVDDSTDDAVVAQDMPSRGRLAFTGGFQIRSHRVGLSVSHVRNLLIAGGASITTTNAPALELTDFAGDVKLDSVSAEGSALKHGVRFRHVTGRVAMNGGTIRSGSSPALDLDDVGQVTFNGLLIDGGVLGTRLHDVVFERVNIRAGRVTLNDLDGSAVIFRHCSFAAPVMVAQRAANGGVIFDGADVSGGSITATANDSSRLRLEVAGGNFNSATIDVTASDKSVVCTEVSSAKFASVETPIRFRAADGAKMTIVGAKSNEVSAIRSAVAQANHGATVSIEASAASVSSASRCP